MKSVLSVVILVLLTSVTTYADIAKPPKRPNRAILHTELEIVPDAKTYEAKLQISQTGFKNFQASLQNGGSAPIVGGIAFSGPRTIIAGLLMFLAVSMGGILLARSPSFGRTQKALGAIVLIAVVLCAAAIITRGNAGPPGSWWWRNLPQALAAGKPTRGGIDIEIVPDEELPGQTMKLIIPLKKQNGSGEE
jgi:ABC-type Na+ efflux pump permease subunit